MHKHDKIIQAISEQGALPLYFHPDENTSLELLQVLYSCGIRVVEYTNRGKQALKNFKSLKKTAGKKMPGLLLGLGTVLDTGTATKALECGADFLVSPGLVKELFPFVKKNNVLWIPGCMTPTELIQVQAAKLGLVKIFPAQIVGTAFIQSVKEIFPDLLFMPTGGVDLENMESWFKAGVSAVGIGSSLISRTIMEKKDYTLLTQKTNALISKIAAIRNTIA